MWGMTDKNLYIFCGPPGAGKSELRSRVFPDTDLHIHDPDMVMKAMPEYQSCLSEEGAEVAFAKWELPARNKAIELLEKEILDGNDIIYDRSCALQDSVDFLNRVKSQGYKLHFRVTLANEDVLKERAAQRDADENRFTPDTVIRERNNDFLKLLPKYRAMADSMIIFNNNSEEKQFHSIAEKCDGELVVTDRVAYTELCENKAASRQL